MADTRNVTDWIVFETAILAADSPKTFEWRGAEDLRGCQFWIDYTGTATVNVDVHLSPVDKKNSRTMAAASHYESVAVEAGAAAAGHFVDPPTEMDRPFGQYRLVVTTDANIVASIGICRHGLG